jgi:hypothetical protein
VKEKVLYLICVAYFLSGLNVYKITAPEALLVQVDPGVTAQLRLFSFHQISLLFVVVTVLCALLAWRGAVNLAYGILTYLIVFWMLLFVISWIQTGYWQSIYNVGNYAMVAGVLFLVSRVVETPAAIPNGSTP